MRRLVTASLLVLTLVAQAAAHGSGGAPGGGAPGGPGGAPGGPGGAPGGSPGGGAPGGVGGSAGAPGGGPGDGGAGTASGADGGSAWAWHWGAGGRASEPTCRVRLWGRCVLWHLTDAQRHTLDAFAACATPSITLGHVYLDGRYHYGGDFAALPAFRQCMDRWEP